MPTSEPAKAGRASGAATEEQDANSMAEALIDLSSYDWLAFPHWAKVIKSGEGHDLLRMLVCVVCPTRLTTS